MLAFEFEFLAALGLTPALASRAVAVAPSAEMPLRLLRVTEVHRNGMRVHDGAAEHSARPLPRVVRALADEGSALAVGDWVIASQDAQGALWIEARVPPTSHIVRRDGDGHPHPVVSNVDTALLVMGLDDDFNPRRLERYLALVQGDGIVPVVVLTKADVAGRHRRRDRRAPRRAPRPRAVARGSRGRERHAPVGGASARRATSARGPDAGAARLVRRGQVDADQHAARRRGAGHRRGAGARQPRQAHDHRAIAASAAGRRLRDRHAGPAHAAARRRRGGARRRASRTSRRSPRSAAFAIAGTATSPAARCAKASGADRLRNYHKLLREMRRDTLTALERQQQLAQWKIRGRAAKVRMKEKRGA